jgi:dolichyl-phosphate-mannose-protein mannosyltransferase
MSSPGGQVRQRNTKDKKRPTTPNPESLSEKISEKVANVVEKAKPLKAQQTASEWDYKLAISVITVLAFITRFWGIRHPDQVVFDEVHFGKVRCVQLFPFSTFGKLPYTRSLSTC